MINFEISSNFNSRNFERQLMKAAQNEIESKLRPFKRLGLSYKWDSRGDLILSGEPEVIKKIQRSLK